MSNFKAWWTFCQSPDRDGSADDSADDGAGLTRWGWTYPTWTEARVYIGGAHTLALFKAMDGDQAGALAQVYFWNRHGGRELKAGLDVAMVDFSWTSGGAVRAVQAMLGVDDDGLWGPITAAAANAQGAAFIDNLSKVRSGYYTGLGFRSRFPGLFTRTNECQKLAHALACLRGIP